MRSPYVVTGLGVMFIVGVLFLASARRSDKESSTEAKNKTLATIRVGDEVHTVTFREAQYGFVTELQPFVADGGNGHVVEGVSVAKVKTGDVERIAFVPASEKIQVNQKVVVYCLTHRDGHTGQFNYTRIAKALPEDYHGF